MPSKVTMKCGTCGSGADVQYAPRPGQIPGASTAGRFICADCLYLEDHPNATRIEQRLTRKQKAAQSETIF